MVKKMVKVLVVLVACMLMTCTAFAGEDSEGYEESGSGFSESCESSSSEDSGSDSGSDDSGSEESSSEPSYDEPAPSPSEPAAVEPAPAPTTAPTSSSDDSSSDDSGSSDPSAPWVAPISPVVVTPVVAPVVETPVETKGETPTVAKKAAVKKTTVLPYEPPYVTEEEAPAEEISAEGDEAEEEVEIIETTSKSGRPYGLLGLLLLPIFAIFFRPYKVVRRFEQNGEMVEEKVQSFFTIKGAASKAEKLLDKRSFASDNIALKIYMKHDDEDTEGNIIDRLCYVSSADGEIRSAADATDGEKEVLVERNLLPAVKAKVIKLTAEAEAWADLAAEA